jgi:hypothetical protein
MLYICPYSTFASCLLMVRRYEERRNSMARCGLHLFADGTKREGKELIGEMWASLVCRASGTPSKETTSP